MTDEELMELLELDEIELTHPSFFETRWKELDNKYKDTEGYTHVPVYRAMDTLFYIYISYQKKKFYQCLTNKD